MNRSFKRIGALSKRNAVEMLRDPLSLLLMLALPLAMEVLFYFLFHKLTSQFSMKYLAPGIAVFSCSFTTLFAGLLIAVDRSTSFLTRLYVTGARAHEFIIGYIVPFLPVVSVQSLVFLLAGCVIEPSLFSVRLIPCLLFSVLISVLFISLGILFGSLCSEKSIGGVTSVIITAQSLLSGMWFPTEGLGGGMVTLMNCLPFKNAVTLLQSSLNGTDDIKKDIMIPLLIILAYTAISFISAVIVFRKKMKAD